MEFIGKKCPVCSAEFKQDDDVVVCPKCGAPYHRDCYKIKGKCIFPALHKEGKSWKSVYCNDTEAQENYASDDSDNTVCRFCGHKNSKDSIVCENCGEFLTGQSAFTHHSEPQNDDSSEELEKIREQIKNVTPVMGSADFYANGNTPFNFGYDLNEDHGGVTAGELSDYVGSNVLYYIPVFSRIKNFNSSRFNFAAFLFNGAWYIYRKQYIKGILISLLMLAISAFQGFAMKFWSGELWEKANNALGVPGYAPTYQEYFKWISENCTNQEMLIMALPYVLSLVSFIVMIFCGIMANKGYYKKAIKTVKNIKTNSVDEQPEDIKRSIIRKGGVHPGAAFTLLTCESIISVAIMYFFS